MFDSVDFTYFIAAVVALIIGFLGSIIFAVAKGHSKRRLMALALVVALAVNFSTLINWAYVGDLSAGFLLLDFAFIAAFSFFGCALGTLPILGIRKLWRSYSRRPG